MSIQDIISETEEVLDADINFQEEVLEICMEPDKLSYTIMTLMDAIHQTEEELLPACIEARQMIEGAREGYAELAKKMSGKDYYRYHELWSEMTQRYCFLLMLAVWLQDGTLATPEAVADILGIDSSYSTNNGDKFHLDSDDYLLGLLMFCSELDRLSVTTVTRGVYQRTLQIFDCVSSIYAHFGLLPLNNEELVEGFENLKCEFDNIQSVVYDLQIRNMFELNITKKI